MKNRAYDLGALTGDAVGATLELLWRVPELHEVERAI